MIILGDLFPICCENCLICNVRKLPSDNKSGNKLRCQKMYRLTCAPNKDSNHLHIWAVGSECVPACMHMCMWACICGHACTVYGFFGVFFCVCK